MQHNREHKWTTLKVILSSLNFCACSDYKFLLPYSNKPYINGKLIYSAFRWCM